MPKKKSVKKSAEDFLTNLIQVEDFVSQTVSNQSRDLHISFIYDYAIIKLYKDFENLMLNALVGAINNDTQALSSSTGFKFPVHLNREVCEYLVMGDGYFDFKGRDGLIKKLKKFLPHTENSHYLVTIIKNEKYKEPLEQLILLRNFAAHESKKSKNSVLKELKLKRIKSSGCWLKAVPQGKRISRLHALILCLRELGEEIRQAAPH